MDILRERLKNRAALRRAWPADKVDPEAIQRFWAGLSIDERLSVLRIDDPAVVQQIDAHMKSLCLLELQQKRTNIGKHKDLQQPRLNGFCFESSSEVDCIGRIGLPKAFCATPEFVESENIIASLKDQLGSDFLAGRPALHRTDWATIVATSPKTWHDFRLQALKLVELALFQAEMEHDLEVSLASQRSKKAKSKKKKHNPSRSVEHNSPDAQVNVDECEQAQESVVASSSAVVVTDRLAQRSEPSAASSSWLSWIPGMLPAAPSVMVVDSDAVQQFWCSLSLEQRLTILRFEDAILVQQIHNHMNTLCTKELRHSRQGGTKSSEPPERLTGFCFEFNESETTCMGNALIPVAFCATAELAMREDLFDVLEETLGSGFLVGRSVVSPQEWRSIVKMVPKSWHELQEQAFRIVELALLHAQQAALTTAIGASSIPTSEQDKNRFELTPEEIGLADCPPSPRAGKRRQGRSRKKKRAAAASSSLLDHDRYPSEAAFDVLNAQEAAMEDSDHENDEDDYGAEQREEEEKIETNIDDTCFEEGEPSRQTCPPSEHRPSESNNITKGQSWKVWMPFLCGSEWAWALSDEKRSQKTFKAVVKNTFLDIAVDPQRQSSIHTRLSRSCHF